MSIANSQVNLQKCVEVIDDSCDGNEALGFVKEISAFHRVQVSKGYRLAAEKACSILQVHGVEAHIHSYPSDGINHYFTQKSFKKWNCTEGWLQIISPWEEIVCDYNREEMSLIQRSASMDFSDKHVPIIYIEESIIPENFNGCIKDSLILVENNFQKWVDRAIELEALGIITVSIPEIKPVRVNISEDDELCDSHANLNFYYYNEEQENKLCGFAISPLVGKRLVESCIYFRTEGKSPLARFKVLSTLEDGLIENVEASIHGETSEEILMISHLCHPRSSINDNVSGVGAAIEAMCTLQRLISNNILKRPKRTIRLLLMPEFLGTYAFLKDNESRLSSIIAGINLDMVGGYQDQNTGPLIIVDTPDSSYSFSGDISSIILEHLSKDCNFGGDKNFVPLIHSLKVPFTFGSDHYILSDPSINIPSVAITQWPDKTYHTSADNISHISTKMLQRSAALAASYCYLYSRFTVSDAKVVIPNVSSRYVEMLISIIRKNKSESYIKNQCDYIKDLYFNTLDRIGNLFYDTELKEVLEEIMYEKDLFKKINNIFFGDVQEVVNLKSKIPTRLFKGPLVIMSIISDLNQKERVKVYNFRNEYKEFISLDDYIIYEVNGIRDFEEISQRVYFQTGIVCDKYVMKLLILLKELDLIEIS